MTQSDRAHRLRVALFFGQHWVVRKLLDSDPLLANHGLDLELALYDEDAVRQRLAEDNELATRKLGHRRPILHLAFSRHILAAPDKEAGMLRIAELLVGNGADVNDGFPAEQDSPHLLSVLYGAIGHAGNLPLARWLLENGADPNDDESLYHSTELGHCEGTRILLQYGARIDGTNALLRSIDFNDHETVGMLLGHGARVNSPVAEHPSGEPPTMVPALHHAGRRMADARMAELLLDAGADCKMLYRRHSPYAYARMYGNRGVAEAIKRHGGNTELDDTESLLAAIAEGPIAHDAPVCDWKHSSETVQLLANLIPFPDKLDHAKRLVDLGFDTDACTDMQMTPLHLAGWEGLPDTMQWLLTFRPDLDHINGYGGDLLSTIIHGSENCPKRESRDHIACARLALEAGVTLGTRTIEFAGCENMYEFLSDWAGDHPEQVVDGGIS